jgi:hypothetical protein
VQLGFLFAGRGRVDSTIVTFAGATGFPATVASRVVQRVERRMSTARGT